MELKFHPPATEQEIIDNARTRDVAELDPSGPLAETEPVQDSFWSPDIRSMDDATKVVNLRGIADARQAVKNAKNDWPRV